MQKSSGGIGSKAFHSLTDKTIQQRRLKTLEFGIQKEGRKIGVKSKDMGFLQIYILLLLFANRFQYKFDTVSEFENFLSQLNLSRNQLILIRRPSFVYISGDRRYRYLETAWESPPSNIDLDISKHYITHRIDSGGKLTPVTSPSSIYYCRIKALTVREIIYSDLRFRYSYFKITKEQAREAFEILRDNNFIRPLATYNNDIIYAISDKQLEGFLQDSLGVYEFVSGLIIDIWSSGGRPKPQEKKWLEFFIGKEGTNRIIIEADDRKKTKFGMTPKEFKEWLKWWKDALKESGEDANKMVMDLKEKHRSTIQKYPFPSIDILELIYPKFLKDTFQITKKNR